MIPKHGALVLCCFLGLRVQVGRSWEKPPLDHSLGASVRGGRYGGKDLNMLISPSDMCYKQTAQKWDSQHLGWVT